MPWRDDMTRSLIIRLFFHILLLTPPLLFPSPASGQNGDRLMDCSDAMTSKCMAEWCGREYARPARKAREALSRAASWAVRALHVQEQFYQEKYTECVAACKEAVPYCLDGRIRPDQIQPF